MEKLGINFVHLLTQAFNFGLLVFVLTKIVYKPILKNLEKRRKKIEEGLILTEKLKKEEEELTAKKNLIIKEAQKEATAILNKSIEHAKSVENEMIKRARQKADEIIERGKKELELKRKELEANLCKETVKIASALTEKLIGEVMDQAKQEAFFKKQLTKFLKQERF